MIAKGVNISKGEEEVMGRLLTFILYFSLLFEVRHSYGGTQDYYSEVINMCCGQ
jgi:hypothetical protein